MLFAELSRAEAGRVAGRLFAVDATIGICVGALLLLLTVQLARADAERGGSRFSAEMMLVLGALFCIVAGFYAVQPMMEAASRGEPGPSFALLHGVASAFFAAKLALVATLAWRLTGPSRGAATGSTKAAAPTS